MFEDACMLEPERSYAIDYNRKRCSAEKSACMDDALLVRWLDMQYPGIMNVYVPRICFHKLAYMHVYIINNCGCSVMSDRVDYLVCIIQHGCSMQRQNPVRNPMSSADQILALLLMYV